MDTERAARFIAKFEGFVDHVYLDPVGVETVGYGETDPEIIEKYRSSGIPEPEAFDLLTTRVAGFAAEVERLIAVPLNDDQLIALTSFAYNLGLGALAESTLRQRLNRGDYASVPSELAKWVYAGNRRFEGLVRRRREEAELFSGGDIGVVPSFLYQRADSGPEVESLQRLLVQKHGFAIVIDGRFGPGTEGAVRQFQERHGLEADGVVGPATWRALNEQPPAVLPDPPGVDQLTVRLGDIGPQVTEVQRLLRDGHGVDTAVDGQFGPHTESAVKELQARAGLDADGVVGPQTWRALHEAPPAPAPVTEFWARPGQQGDGIAALQAVLIDRHGYRLAVDGNFGPATERAVVDFQGRHGLEPDGIVGPLTWKTLVDGEILPPPQDHEALGWEAIDGFLVRRGVAINVPPESWQTTGGVHSATSFHYARFDPAAGYDIGHARDYSAGMGCDEHRIVEVLRPYAVPGGPVIELYHAPTGTWLYDGQYWNVGGHEDHVHASIRPGMRMPD